MQHVCSAPDVWKAPASNASRGRDGGRGADAPHAPLWAPHVCSLPTHEHLRKSPCGLQQRPPPCRQRGPALLRAADA